MWYVYIIEGKDSRLYTGITNNLDRRLAEHNRGCGGKYTRSRGPFKLRFRKGAYNRSQALKQEAVIKKLRREEKLELISSFRI